MNMGYVAPSANIQFRVEMGTRSRRLTVDLSAMHHQQLVEAAAQVLELAPGVTFGLVARSPLGNFAGVDIEIANDRDVLELMIHAQKCIAKRNFTVVLKVVNFTAPAFCLLTGQAAAALWRQGLLAG